MSYGLSVSICPDVWSAPGLDVSPLAQPIETHNSDEGKVVEVSLLPAGLSGPYRHMTVQVAPENTSPIACLACRRYKSGAPDTVAERILARVNEIRASDPRCLFCSPLIDDGRCKAAALRYLTAKVQGISTSWESVAGAEGISYFNTRVLDIFIEKPPQSLSLTDDDIELVVSSWMSSGTALLSGMYKRAGVSLYFVLSPQSGWWVALGLADGDPQSTEDVEFDGTAPDLPCGFSCIQKLQYYREVIATKFHNEQILSDHISFRWSNPNLCNLYKIELWGDVRGLRATWICGEEAVCSGDIVGGVTRPIFAQRMSFECRDIPPYPGEWFAVWGYLRGAPDQEDCHPILIACCYFSHFCYTSGEIMSICLVEGENVVAEVTSGSTPSNWIGDSRLRYKVLCEGVPLYVIPSDFAEYYVGNRIVIHKGGSHTRKTAGGGSEKESGCQDPEGATPNDLLRWDLVNYYSAKAQGEIIPQRFWGI